MKNKFTFKKNTPVGKFAVFQTKYTDIKFNKKVCGSINRDREYKWKILLSVMKNEKFNDGNENCDWMNIVLKTVFEKEEQARDFLNNNIDKIMDTFTLHFIEE